MVSSNGQYINGYLERKVGGKYEGEISIEGISLSPISGVSFKQDGKMYLWLKRKDMLVYDPMTQSYSTRKKEPRWEAYLEKQMEGQTVAYKGEFLFMRFRFSIVGVWDSVLGKEKTRMNFFVERLPMDRQDIINGINQRKAQTNDSRRSN